jgi:hypothetical protein
MSTERPVISINDASNFLKQNQLPTHLKASLIKRLAENITHGRIEAPHSECTTDSQRLIYADSVNDFLQEAK